MTAGKTLALLKRKIYLPIKLKLVLSHLFVSLIPILLIYGFTFSTYSKNIMDDANRSLSISTDSTAREISFLLYQQDQMIDSLYSSHYVSRILHDERWFLKSDADEKLRMHSSLSEFLRFMESNDAYFFKARITPLHGNALLFCDSILTVGYQNELARNHEEIVRSGAVYFSSPFVSLSPHSINSSVIAASKAVFAADGNVAGTISVEFRTRKIINMLTRSAEQNGSDVCIMDSSGSIIMQSDNFGSAGALPDYSYIKMRQNPGGSFNITGEDKEKLIHYSTIDLTDWTLVTISDPDRLLAGAYTVRRLIFVTGLLALIASVTLSVMISVMVTSPLLRLKRGFDDVKRNNYNVFLPVLAWDEIGRLTHSFNAMTRRVRRHINLEYEAQLRYKEAELRALEAQINPHFLYNTLETIRSIAYVNDVEEIAQMAADLSELFRYSIDHQNRVVRLKDELYYTNHYLNIYKVRFGDAVEVAFDIPEHIGELYVIKLLLQPIIENSLNHGLDLLGGAARIAVAARLREDILEIEIRDNGGGISPGKLAAIRDQLKGKAMGEGEQKGGIGILNVHMRIKNYYGDKYGLAIDCPQSGGTRVILSLPAIADGDVKTGGQRGRGFKQGFNDDDFGEED